MEKSADKAMAAVSIIIPAARPVAVVGKKLEHVIQQRTAFSISASGIDSIAPDLSIEFNVSPATTFTAAKIEAARERGNSDRLWICQGWRRERFKTSRKIEVDHAGLENRRPPSFPISFRVRK